MNARQTTDFVNHLQTMRADGIAADRARAALLARYQTALTDGERDALLDLDSDLFDVVEGSDVEWRDQYARTFSAKCLCHGQTRSELLSYGGASSDHEWPLAIFREGEEGFDGTKADREADR